MLFQARKILPDTGRGTAVHLDGGGGARATNGTLAEAPLHQLRWSPSPQAGRN